MDECWRESSLRVLLGLGWRDASRGEMRDDSRTRCCC